MNISSINADMQFSKFHVKHRELNMRGAELLREILNNPPIQMNDDCKAIFTYEIFTLVSGRDYLELLSQFHALLNKDNS